ncbi:MAG: hypothetical protein H3C35_08465 [Bacteroidetes bacterium]|nr:hypothetical protein [Bacteroidota bacterium]
MKSKTSEIKIDYSVTLADCIMEAERCYPLAKQKEESVLCYFYYCKGLMTESTKTNNEILYNAKLRYHLLRLATVGEEQVN